MSDLPLYLAPLAGYTDQAFRTLCKDWGADYLVSEMVSADGLIRDSRRTEAFIQFSEPERPFGVQLFGSDPLILARAAEAALAFRPDFIDLNMGCPVKKVIKRGAGSALMKDPDRASRMVVEVRKALAGAVPLSVKFRSGWDCSSMNFLEFGQIIESAGADMVCLHPRTTKQMFSGVSNWEHIHNLKQVLQIPVIGNGDVTSPEKALQMLQQTGCDGIMIGRGALGKPWLFRQIKEYLGTGNLTPVTHSVVLNTALKHLENALLYKREDVVVREMRSQLCHYTKGFLGGAQFRNQLNHASSAAEIRDLLRTFIH